MAGNEIQMNLGKFARVPYASKGIENETERSAIKNKLLIYLVLDLAIVALLSIWYSTNENYFSQNPEFYVFKNDTERIGYNQTGP
jgi:hypothetical protein